MNSNEVNTAFEILIEEIELVANNLNEEGAKAIKAGSYDVARRLMDEAERLADFREKVRALQKEWASLQPRHSSSVTYASRKVTNSKARLPRGLRTPEDAFRRPILEALVELGGEANLNEILDLVGVKMKATLTQYDFQSLRSSPRSPRWRNTAQWCRNKLVRDGLMRADSPYGIWAISEAGRRALQDGDL